ncbi:MAG: DNA gyrase subunit A [Candidatus Micrarchaeota archaeon]|nr:DNA gyrase subunit A [Candidatus Micrarchaeota archaeon]
MEEVIDSDIEKEMQSSYIDYAMSVIVGRALPDARDGLKPAQRRILYTMYKINNTHDQPTKKSARIVGECMGKYHPHGDMAVYDTLVRMAQNFSMNHMLVEGQGNMGSIDGDPPAAQRYTEVRLSKISDEMLADLEKKSVTFVPNFDNTEEEPLLLPTKLPHLLLNGASGIAVGVATNIMPHNLSELCDAIIAYIKNHEITSEELLQYVLGPDLPTGGTVFYNNALVSSYITGRGTVTIRGKHSIEKIKNRSAIIITEIPYTVNKASMVEAIANLVKTKRITGISDLRDESGKEGIRIVIELRQDADLDVVLNTLYRHTQLETSMPVMNIAVIGNNLVTLNLRQFIKIFIEHRISVITKRTQYDLSIASDRLHIVEGLLVAVRDIDGVISAIKASEDLKSARSTLMEKYMISERQANAILDMKLSKLTNLETSSLETERGELTASISSLKAILEDDKKVYDIIEQETAYIKGKYGRDRRTDIDKNVPEKEFDNEDLIKDEEATIILTNNNYMKRISTKVYRSQERGGKGVIAIQLKEGDFVKQIVSCMLKDYLLVLSNKGRAYWLKAYMVPEEGRYGIGKAAVNLVKFSEGEKVGSIINTRVFEKSYLTFITAKGKIKRVRAEKFSRPRANGIMAMPLRDGDELSDVCLSNGNSELFIATRRGKALRFREEGIRPMSRIAHGVRGIRLNPEDRVVNVLSANGSDLIASITEKGYGKVTELDRYRTQARGGKGVINLKTKEKTGYVVKALKVANSDNVILISSKGISITFPVEDIRVTGRAASGVRLMRLDDGATIVDAQTITKYVDEKVA